MSDPRSYDYHWDAMEARMRREEELERMAESLAKMLDHELAELSDAEADFVRRCLADLGW